MVTKKTAKKEPIKKSENAVNDIDVVFILDATGLTVESATETVNYLKKRRL